MVHPFSRLSNAFILLLILRLSRLALAARNITIDDTNGDSVNGFKPTYNPPDSWKGVKCAGCVAQLDKNQAYNNTWSSALADAGSEISIDIPFSGTAVYAYFILANDIEPGKSYETGCNFSVDGNQDGTFQHSPGSTKDFQYNVLVYSKTGLSNGNHSLKISSTGQNNKTLYLNFDRVDYTVEDGQSNNAAAGSGVPSSSSAAPSSSASSLPGKASGNLSSEDTKKLVIGSVIGGLCGLGVIGFIFFLCYRRRQRYQELLETIQYHGDHHDEMVAQEKALQAKSFFDDSSSSIYTGELPETHYPGGYAPYGVPIPPQAHIQQNRPSPNEQTQSRLSRLSQFPILQRTGTFLTQSVNFNLRRHGSQKNPSPSPDEMRAEMRRIKLRDLERQEWRLRNDIRDLEADISRRIESNLSYGEDAEDQHVLYMREQIEMLEDEIEHIREQHQDIEMEGERSPGAEIAHPGEKPPLLV